MNPTPNIVTLPPESLLGRHEPWEVRAWRHVERTQYSRGMEDGANELAELYGLPAHVVADALRGTTDLDDVRGRLGKHWVEQKTPGAAIHPSRDGRICVQPPLYTEVVRRVLSEWRCSTPALQGFVTQDLYTLAQLLTAEMHAKAESSILIVGDTGTGKEVIANMIHGLSGRTGTMVRLNCTAIADSLFASELFGHVRGAFTGADKEKDGYVASAKDGTLFLDEIGELAPEHQPRLLRLLREREYFQVGSHELKRSTARVIAATNADVEDEAATGYFRSDLFQRLGGCRLKLRPLRERHGDVPVLLQHFATHNGHQEGFSAAAASLLEGYTWPGNVAELRACVEHATTLGSKRAIDIVDLPDHIVDEAYPRRGTARSVFVLADFLARARGDAETSAAEEATLKEVLDRELEHPPIVGGDAELDALVRTTVAATVAFAAIRGGGTFDVGEVDARVELVRRAGLLAEVQTAAQDRGRGGLAGLAAQELRKALTAEDQLPWLGVAIKVIVSVLASDDPDERREIIQLAGRLKASAPLLAGLVGRLGQLSRSSAGPADEAMNNLPAEAAQASDDSSAQPWHDPAKRAEVERALEQASGNQAKAARSLGLTERYFRTIVKRQDLGEYVSQLKGGTQPRSTR